MANSPRLYNAIARRATAWAGQLTKLAKSYAPNHLKPFIHSKRDDKGDGTFSITIYVDKNAMPTENLPNQKYGSSDARAQEYGSGEFARRGPKTPIPIRPKNRKFLAFNWEVANASPENFDFLPDGRVVLKSVLSPGTKAANDGQGYIAPAVKELKAKAREDLDPAIRQAIMEDIRVSFRGAKKK